MMHIVAGLVVDYGLIGLELIKEKLKRLGTLPWVVCIQ